MKVVIILLAVLLFAAMLTGITGSVEDFRTDEFEQAYAVTTTGATTTATLKLPQALWQSNAAYASFIATTISSSGITTINIPAAVGR